MEKKHALMRCRSSWLRPVHGDAHPRMRKREFAEAVCAKRPLIAELKTRGKAAGVP